MKRITFLLSSILLLINCRQQKSGLITISDDAEDVLFENVAKDIRVVPLLSDSLIDGCFELYCYGNETFILNTTSRIVYYFVENKLVNILNAVGRGPGEYNRIKTLTYCSKEKILYVCTTANKILWYSIPDMKYCGNTPLYKDITTFFVHDNESFLISEVGDSICSLKLIDKSSGDSIKTIQNISNYAYNRFEYSGRSYRPNSRVLSILGNQNDVCFISDDNELISILKYDFGKKSIPEKYLNWVTNDMQKLMVIFSFQISDEADKFYVGGDFLKVTDNEVSFWYNKLREPQSENNLRFYRYKNGHITNLKGFTVPGLKNPIVPMCVADKGYATIFEGTSDMYIDNTVEASPLAKKILHAMDSQNDNNPVLVYFDIKNH